MDLWGDAALRQPDGPSYEYFAGLLPPLRYVDAPFLYYPIVLSAPTALVKGRLVSNGSAINALARHPIWRSERGIPLDVRVGNARQPFGADLAALDGPRYVDGHLPIVRLSYVHRAADGDEKYAQEVFASTEPALAASGAIFARFSFPAADRGLVELQLENGTGLLVGGKDHVVRDPAGKILAAYDDNWDWNRARSSLMSKTKHAESGVIVLFTAPAEASSLPWRELAAGDYERHRQLCGKTWDDLLATGMSVSVPEQVVNDAWRSLIVGTFGIIAGDQVNYSAGNQYALQYAHESGDTIRSLLLWGHRDAARRAFTPLLKYRRRNIEFYDAAFNLQSVASCYFITHDADFVRSSRPLWQPLLDKLLAAREAGGGMLPREKYCSDIDTQVYSSASNALAWRAVRDIGLTLEDVGEHDEAVRLAGLAAEYRTRILSELEKATVRTVDPPFIPIAMGEEEVHDPITSTRQGSYWNLVIGSLLSSGVFRCDSQPASDLLRYIQTKGGLCMGMTRVLSARGWWVGQPEPRNIDDLYGVRYALTLLERDEPDRALVSFYGKLAQGMTRDTFIDGESTSIIPLDRFGRQIGLPPNSTANASFLLQLRYVLVQDYDLDDDGRPETLRLAFATPRRWMADGKQIKVERAPTAFGEVSYTLSSSLAEGTVRAELSLPPVAPRKTLLRLRLPTGFHISHARVEGDANPRRLPLDREDIDLSGLAGLVRITATCSRGDAK
jgi:hypothetical protein